MIKYMTYFHIWNGRRRQASKSWAALQLDEARGYLIRRLHSLGWRSLAQQEMTTRAGQQPFSWATVALAPSWHLHRALLSWRPTRGTRPTAPGYRRTELRAAPGMSVWPGLLLWPCCSPPSPLRIPVMQHIPARSVSGTQPLCPKRQLWVGLSLTPQYQRAMQTS